MKENVKSSIVTFVSALAILVTLLTVTNKESAKDINYTKEAYSSPFSITENYNKIGDGYATNVYGRVFAKDSEITDPEITDPYSDYTNVMQAYRITAHPNGVSEYTETNDGYTQIELPEYMSIEGYIKTTMP